MQGINEKKRWNGQQGGIDAIWRRGWGMQEQNGVLIEIYGTGNPNISL